METLGGSTMSLEERIRKALDSDVELAKFLEEFIEKLPRSSYAINFPEAVRVYLEKLPRGQYTYTLDFIKLLVEVEYLKGKRLLAGEPAEILTVIAKTLLDMSMKKEIMRNELERARLIAEAIYARALEAME